MAIKVKQISLVTDSSGDFDSDNIAQYTTGISIGGRIVKMHLTHANHANTADITVTDKLTGENIWAETDISAASTVRPFLQAHTSAGVNVAAVGETLLQGEPVSTVQVVIAQGGDTKTDILYIYYEV